MPDFADTVAGMPGLKDLPAATRDGLTERVTAEVCGAHRWPFLLKVQNERTWAANDAIQTLPGIFRIWNIMYPASNGDYYALTELSDMEFQNWIELNPNTTSVGVWRDAGTDGNDLQVELYAVPTGATTLKIDYTVLPTFSDIDELPFRFQNLIMHGMMAAVGVYHNLAFQQDMQLAIAREQDLQGKRSHVVKDPIQNSRWNSINNPS